MKNATMLTGSGFALQYEGQAKEAGIKPGHFVEESADGEYLRNNAAADENAVNLIAIEDGANGQLVTEAYANDDNILVRAVAPGMRVQARVAAGASAILFGDKLSFDGDGGLAKATAGDLWQAEAKEAVDNSGGAADAFITVQML